MRFLDIFLNREQAYEERRQILFLKQRLQIYEEGAKDKRAEFCAKVIDVVGLLGDDASLPIICAILQLCQALLQYEGHLYLPNVNRQPTSTADMWRLRAEILRSLKPFEEQNIYELLLDAVCTFVKCLTEDIPRISSDDKNDNSLAVPLYALLRNPAYAIERLLHMPYQDDLIRAELFEHLRVQFYNNLCFASGIDPQRADKSSKALTLPTKADISPIDLIDTYLAGTPFSDFLQTPLPFSIPFRMRFEHTHIVGGTGHGKTQLLQHLILRDIDALSQGHGSIIVIDSQGDMLRNILQLAHLSPVHKDSIANRLILIDPNDVEHPPALNLFDFGLELLSRYAPVEREKLINGAIALYEYVFGALLGADLTQRQGVIFRYLARLIMTIPGATIHTLMRFMEEPEETRGYFSRLDNTTRHFFETQFFSRSFDDTRQQILTRLWGVLSNRVLERMFANEHNKIDLFAAMNRGSLILINTAKDLLKQEGCEIFGRFFIALITQATQERTSIPEERRRSTFVYIDEAQDYFDESIQKPSQPSA